MHLDEERIQRLLHVELLASVEEETRAHLAVCAECRARIETARREEHEFHERLGHLDQPAPALEVEAVLERATGSTRRHGRPRVQRQMRATERLHEFASFQRAAAFVGAIAIVGAAFAVYAAPGSPLRAWITSVAERMTGAREDAPEPNPSPRATTDSSQAGIAVAPGRTLVILFTTPRAESDVEVSLTDRAEIEVRGPIGAATYTSDAERLVIDNRGSPARFAIEVPRDAPHVEIRVGGTRLFLKDGSSVATSVAADTTTPYRFRLGH